MPSFEKYVYNVPQVKSIADIVDSSADLYPDNNAFVEKVGENEVTYTFTQVKEYVKNYAAYLCSKGLAGKRVAVIGKNCKEWAMTYLAVLWGVGVIVPLDRDLQADEIKNLLSISKANAIVYTSEQEEKINEAVGQRKTIKIPAENLFDYVAEGEKLYAETDDPSSLRHINNPNEMGVLLFTSGTTGVSKGVMLSQYNIACNIMSVRKQVMIYPTDRVLSVLPLHHTFESMSGFMSVFYSGGCIAYNSSLRRMQSELLFYKPTVLIAVPLVFETFHKKIVSKYKNTVVGAALLGASKGLMKLTGAAGARTIFKPVHDALGGNMRAILCGAAALKPNVFRDYEKFGLLVYNGYGLTETSPVCIMHNDSYRCADDIGYPILGVKAKIINRNDDGAGELCVKGPNIMLGYYENPEATAEVIDEDGWFHTGDLAKINPNGSFAIVGRTKSMIVLNGGKKVFPEEIEHYVDASPLVAESLVFGRDDETNGTQVCATVYPNKEAVDEALKKEGITPDSENYFESVKRKITEEVNKACKKLPYFKAVRRVFIRTEEFVKTTTRKIKRFDPENLKESKEDK